MLENEGQERSTIRPSEDGFLFTFAKFPVVDSLLGKDNLRSLTSNGLDRHDATQEIVLARDGLFHHAVYIDFDQLWDFIGRRWPWCWFKMFVALELDPDAFRYLFPRFVVVPVRCDHDILLDRGGIVFPQSAEASGIDGGLRCDSIC